MLVHRYAHDWLTEDQHAMYHYLLSASPSFDADSPQTMVVGRTIQPDENKEKCSNTYSSFELIKKMQLNKRKCLKCVSLCNGKIYLLINTQK